MKIALDLDREERGNLLLCLHNYWDKGPRDCLQSEELMALIDKFRDAFSEAEAKKTEKEKQVVFRRDGLLWTTQCYGIRPFGDDPKK